MQIGNSGFPSDMVWGSATLESCLILGKKACFTKIGLIQHGSMSVLCSTRFILANTVLGEFSAWP